MCYIRVVNRTGFLSHGLPMMHKQMCGVLTWQQIAAAIVLCSHYSRPSISACQLSCLVLVCVMYCAISISVFCFHRSMPSSVLP
ncbi:hypothetical protein AAZX31_04G067600 [Glycine max]